MQLLTAFEEKQLALAEVFPALGTIQLETQSLPVRALQLPRVSPRECEIAARGIQADVPSSNYPHQTIE